MSNLHLTKMQDKRIILVILAFICAATAAPTGSRVNWQLNTDGTISRGTNHWPAPGQLPYPNLSNVNPWGTKNAWTCPGNIVTAPIMAGPNEQSSPVDALVSVDPFNQIWFFNGTTEFQWAFVDSAYAMQGDFCFPISNWNFSMQVSGYSFLQNAADNYGKPILYGGAWDITSCFNMIASYF